MRLFGNIRAKWPTASEELPDLVDEMINSNAPYYLNLKR
jgi:hypothetical protein